MTHYSIKELEEISGMKAHTIRIWELRYGLLKPERTDTNIRYYDDSQLKKLLNVCALMSEGMKISKISELNEKQIGEAIDKIINKSTSTDASIETIINQLLIAVTTFDELLFNKVFSTAVVQLGLVETYLKIIYPLLSRLGLMWSKGDVMPAQEHFFSNLIKQKLFVAIDATPMPQNTNQTWLLFLPETESHEIGLLLANYIIRSHGKKVIYLGQNVPYENISKVINSCKLTHAYTFYVKNHSEKNAEQQIGKLLKEYKNLKVCISGKETLIEKITKKHKVVWIKQVQSLLEILK